MTELASWDNYFGPEWTLLEHSQRFPNSVRDATPPAEGVSTAAKATAIVSGGVWVARCPLKDCHGCEIVSFTRGTFFCCECRNAAWKHQPIQVVVPDDATRAKIEAALVVRPVPATRNWVPPETVADLAAENVEHGIV